MTSTDWAALLHEPKAILGPYGGTTPPLSTFAPHGWRARFDCVAIAGQFMCLPDKLPPSWGAPEHARADVIFNFSEVRQLRVEGVLESSIQSDIMHGKFCGVPGQCSLIALPDALIDDPNVGVYLPWIQFTFSQPSFLMVLEAASVRIDIGRRAAYQFDRI